MHSTNISIHFGAHCTDDDQLIKSLLRNQDVLSEHGVSVPGPGRYRPLLREVLDRLDGAPANLDTQDVIFEAILESDGTERLVLSNDNFLGNSVNALKNGLLYRNAGRNSAALRNLFPDSHVEFFLAVRNPATFVPALHQVVQPGPFEDYVAGVDPDTLVWSDVVLDIREHNPETPITVWCNEDTPMIWPEVMHEVGGLDPQVKLMGGFDILARIMAKEGIKRLRSYLASHPPANEIQRRRVLAAFLDKYALDDEVEEEIDLPGWTPELMDQFTANYDDDLIEIARIPGVTVLTA
ncbi:hypothetical protein [Sinisalibacter lacisalsi]|uniref:Uncharacterized protein n=1 Tax=Sinisalibacter lacisalsi TaxID=1526570 RepID=A0ABQ1QUA0_9RHOB|nr:hypothetical protein [Sinisalibacter lacisalsi]GGD44080.1 hypothetical protein GCM10011358_29800 [Sinisalibacter lacisalsi]